MESDRRDRGFSLIELLVVIVILGILATVTVFAVRGIADRGETSACDGDRRIMTQAMEARYADRGSYADEATLATEGFMRGSSELHDITLSGNDYTVVAVGTCAGSATTIASGGPVTTTTVTNTGPTLFPTAQFGSGSIQILVLTYGMPPSRLQDIQSLCDVSTTFACLFVLTGNSVVRVEDLVNNLIAHPSNAYWDYTEDGPITVFQQDGVTPVIGPNSTLHDFLVGAFDTLVISPPPPGGP